MIVNNRLLKETHSLQFCLPSNTQVGTRGQVVRGGGGGVKKGRGIKGEGNEVGRERIENIISEEADEICKKESEEGQ